MANNNKMYLASRILSLGLSLSLAGAFMSATPAVFGQNSQAVVLNNDGVRALNSGNFQLAIQKFEEALKVDPSYSYAKENLAIAYNNYALKVQNNPQAALKAFHKSLALNPNNPTTRQNLEIVIKNLGKDPRSFKDRIELGQQARQSADFEGAMVEFAAALQIKDDPKTHIDLANVYRVRDRNTEAINEYQAALKGGLDPSDKAMAYVKLGQAYQAKKDLPNAIAAFGEAIKYKSDDKDVLDALKTGWEQALRENPTAPENHIGLGQAYQYMGDFGQAEAEYKQALIFDKNNQIARKLLASLADARRQFNISKHINAGVDLQTRKMYDDAIREYTAALQMDPNNAALWVNIGSAFQQKEDYDRALAAYQKAQSIDPANAGAKEGIKSAGELREAKNLDNLTKTASDLYKQGKYAEALAAYQRVQQKTPNDAAIYFNIGAAQQQLNQIDAAIASYQQAVKLDSKNEQYAKTLDDAFDIKAKPIIDQAVAKHQKKDYQGAVELYNQAIALRPKNVSLYFNAASAYYSLQMYPQAKDYYTKALALDPKGQVDDLWLLGTIAEHFSKGYDAMDLYKKYLAAAPTGKFAQGAKDRLDALTKNPQDTVKIKSETELAQIEEAHKSYDMAVKLQQQNQFDQALPLYQKAMSLQPMDATYPFGLGTLYQAKGDFDNAIAMYQKATDLDPKNKEYPKAVTYAKAKKAEPIVEQALKKQTAQDAAGAIPLYLQALQLVTDNAKLWTNLATAYQATDELLKARDAYQKAVDMDPKNESANWFPIAAIDENFGKGPQAIGEYKKFVQLNAGNQLVAAANTRIQKLTANPNDIQKLPTHAEMVASKNAQDAFDQAVKLQQAGQYDQALPLYQQAAAAVPSEPAYPYAIGTVFQAKGDFDQAISWYQKAAALAPSNKDYPKVIEAARELKAAPIVDEAAKKYTAGDFTGAIPLYKQALQWVPNNAAVHTDLAGAYQASDDFANALNEYQTAYKLDPKGQSEVLYLLGALEEHFAKGADALRHYREYMTQNPNGKFKQYAQQRIGILAANPSQTQRLQTQAEAKNTAELQGVFDKAVQLQQANKYDEADAVYAELIAKAPNEGNYYYARGTNAQAKGDVDNAIAYYDKAVSLQPSNAEFKKWLQTAKDLKAAQIMEQAVQKHTAGDLAGAVELYKAALAASPKNAKGYTNLAGAYQAMDNFQAARDAFQKGYDLDPKGEAENLYFIGLLDEHMNRGKEALADYTKYQQYNPKGKYINEAKARYQVLYFDPNKTQKLVTQAQQQQQAKVGAAYNEGVALQQQQKYDEAIAKYDEGLKESPNSDTLWYAKGTAYQAKNDIDQAIAAYQKAISINAGEAAYKQALKQVKLVKAQPVLDEAIKKQTANDLAGAIVEYESALKLVPDDAQTNLNAGTAYQAHKTYPKALELYNRGIQLDPKVPEGYYYRATLYETMGQGAKAIPDYRKYIQLSPSGQYCDSCRERLKALTGKPN